MSSKYKKYLNSDSWKELKIDLLVSRGCKCEKCGKNQKPQYLQVHHKTYKNIFQENPEDLILVCGKCHMKEHGLIKEKKKTKPRPKKVKKYKNVWQVVNDAKNGKLKTNKQILSAYSKRKNKG